MYVCKGKHVFREMSKYLALSLYPEFSDTSAISTLKNLEIYRAETNCTFPGFLQIFKGSETYWQGDFFYLFGIISMYIFFSKKRTAGVGSLCISKKRKKKRPKARKERKIPTTWPEVEKSREIKKTEREEELDMVDSDRLRPRE